MEGTLRIFTKSANRNLLQNDETKIQKSLGNTWAATEDIKLKNVKKDTIYWESSSNRGEEVVRALANLRLGYTGHYLRKEDFPHL